MDISLDVNPKRHHGGISTSRIALPATARRFPLPDQVDELPPSKAAAFSAATPAMIALDYQGGHSVRQRQKSWTRVSASVAQVHCNGDLYVDLAADSAQLSVVLEQVGGCFEIRSEDWRGRPAARGDAGLPLSVIPADLPAHGKAEGIRFIRHLVLRFDTAALERVVDDEIDLTNVFAPRLMFADPHVMRLAQLFADECMGDAPNSRLYGDNLSIALLLALSRLCAAKPPAAVKRGCLAPWQLRRVSDYVHAHLTEDMQLHALSNMVRLSRSYFSRAFKMSTGLAPHQWVLEARIAKAKQLMLAGNTPLAQIAVDVGFADQAHFTRNFGRAVGESPANWRRNRST